MSTVGNILRTVGNILSTVGDIMIHMGDSMSTVRGYNLLLFGYLHGTEHSRGTHDISHM